MHAPQGSFSAPAAERKLEAAAAARLRADEHYWASAEADGQSIVLTGAAPTNASRAQAVRSAARSAGPGGVILGGVTRVREDAVDVGGPPPLRPFNWSARLDAGRLVLSGEAPPSEAPRRLIVTRAEQLFPSGVVDEMTPAPGEPEGWTQAVETALAALAELESGRVSLQGERLSFTGMARAADEAAAAQARLARLEGFDSSDIDIELAEPAPSPDATDDPAAQEERSAPDLEACQQDFDAFAADRFVQFETGSAELERASYAALERLVEVARRCEGYRLVIEGHTDDRGEADMNMELSIARAETVADFLISRGLARERVAARGLGEDEPIADNATREGRAANRRIAFRVLE